MQLLYLAVRTAKEDGGPKRLPGYLATALQSPLVSLASCNVGIVGWIVWIIFAEKARQNSLAAVDAFQLTLEHEPWPMWAPIPVSLAWIMVVAALVAVSYWRQALQRAAASGADPFPASGDCGTPGQYFTRATLANAAAWLVKVWLVTLLVAYGVWAAAAGAVHVTASKVLHSYSHDPAAATAVTGTGGGGGAAAAGMSPGSLPALQALATPWGPDWPGKTCPPGCLDLSAFDYYFGANACTCNAIGGVFAADPHAKAAACNVVCAMAGMALMYVAASWLVMDVACQISHTQSEILTGTALSPAGAASSQSLAGWLLTKLGSSSSRGGGAGRAGGFGVAADEARQGLL